MKTVKNIVDATTDKSLSVQILGHTTRDLCEPMVTELYTGRLDGVPESLIGLEVLGTAYSVGQDMPVIDVLTL